METISLILVMAIRILSTTCSFNGYMKTVADEQMPWLQVSDLTFANLSKLCNFRGIPFCVLVDPDGMIVSRTMRGPWLVLKMMELYGNKFGDK